MQKVLQRAARAERVASRKRAKLVDHRERGEGWARRKRIRDSMALHAEHIRQARINRRIDWETGPLAPRRDVGDKATTYAAYSVFEFGVPRIESAKRPKVQPIREGDRVVVIRGRERGKIGILDEFDEESLSAKVRGMNYVDINVPDWLQAEERNSLTGNIASQSHNIGLEDLRLVYPLPDPKTGVPRDVVIERLEEVEGVGRVIGGTNIAIPYPETEGEMEYEDHEEDTPRIDVDEVTFRPVLMAPPMPLSVIDELRNKYSRFRTRHDREYIEQKMAEDERVEKRKELIKGMHTPLQQLAELRRKQVERERQKELTDEQLARIGEVIAAERAKVMEAVKMSP